MKKTLLTEESEDVLQMLRSIKNLNFQDEEGFSYLHRACQAHNVEAIKILLEPGANHNINEMRGAYPILEAIERINEKNNEILEIMLKHGLDLVKME